MEAVNLLLRSKADLAIEDRNHRTVLHKAAEIGTTKIVECLLEGKADINLKSSKGKTALCMAIEAGKADSTAFLLDSKANITLEEKSGYTLFHQAAKTGHTEIVKLLITAKANIGDDQGGSSLPGAIARGDENMVELLLQKGAPLRDDPDYPLLHQATKTKKKKIVKLLLDKRVDISMQDSGGGTALHWASANGDTEIMQLLLARKADANIKDKGGSTALHLAVMSDVKEAVEILLESITDDNVNSQDKGGYTPLMLVSRRFSKEDTPSIVESLLESDAELEIKNNQTETALQIAAKCGETGIEVIKILMRWGAEWTKDMGVGECKQYLQGIYNSGILPETIGTLNKRGFLRLSFRVKRADIDFDESSRPFAEGGYGAVYLGTFKIYNQVAIKKLHATTFHAKIREEFLKEASVMANISMFSEYLVKLQGVCFKPPCMVMEYMPAGNLHELLKRDPYLSRSNKYQIGYDIAVGLHHLHRLKLPMIHGDLKSLNVLLKCRYNYRGEIFYKAKLCDFGLASTKRAIVKAETHSGDYSPGTVQWMAPELLFGKETHNQKSDIFALGLVIWELTTHRIPYEKLRQEIIQDIEIMDILPDIRRKLKDQFKNIPGTVLWKKSDSWNDSEETKELDNKEIRLSINADNDDNFDDDDVSIEFAAFSGKNYKLLDTENIKGKIILSAFWDVVRDRQQEKIKTIMQTEDIFSSEYLSIPKRTPSAIVEIIKACCQLAPNKRTITAKEVSDRFKQLLNEERDEIKERGESKKPDNPKLKSSFTPSINEKPKISSSWSQTTIGSLRKSFSCPSFISLRLAMTSEV